MDTMETFVFDEELQTWFLVTLPYALPTDMCVVYDENGHVQLPVSRLGPARTGPCRNCLAETHDIDQCQLECGYCGQNWHSIDTCESIPRNRCKCSPFPQHHLAKRCPVLCNPDDCPKKDQPGSSYHRNAVMCKARCCMCGLHGHAGRDCHLKTCRCGRQHLAIDHPSEERRCAAEPCPRWFCNKHCQLCKEPSEACRCTKDKDKDKAQDQTQQPAPEPEPAAEP